MKNVYRPSPQLVDAGSALSPGGTIQPVGPVTIYPLHSSPLNATTVATAVTLDAAGEFIEGYYRMPSNATISEIWWRSGAAAPANAYTLELYRAGWDAGTSEILRSSTPLQTTTYAAAPTSDAAVLWDVADFSVIAGEWWCVRATRATNNPTFNLNPIRESGTSKGEGFMRINTDLAVGPYESHDPWAWAGFRTTGGQTIGSFSLLELGIGVNHLPTLWAGYEINPTIDIVVTGVRMGGVQRTVATTEAMRPIFTITDTSGNIQPNGQATMRHGPGLGVATGALLTAQLTPNSITFPPPGVRLLANRSYRILVRGGPGSDATNCYRSPSSGVTGALRVGGAGVSLANGSLNPLREVPINSTNGGVTASRIATINPSFSLVYYPAQSVATP